MLQPEKKKKIPARRYRRFIPLLIFLAMLFAGTLFVVQKLTRPAQLAILATASGESGVAGKNTFLYVINADGSGQSPLPAQAIITYDWSPDGSRLAYSAFRGATTHSSDIYVMNADGSKRLPVTVKLPQEYSYSAPVWSPDGTKLAFTAQDSHRCEIWIMNADGSDSYMLYSQPDLSPPPYGVWSPDGAKIAYRAQDSNVYVLEITGSMPQQLTYAGDIYRPPVWSPDGTRLLIERSHDGEGGTFEIFVINADGSNRINLSNHRNTDEKAVWSPDGNHVAFSSRRDGNYDLYRVDADGTHLTRLTWTEVAFETDPMWSPDGTHISFERFDDDRIYTVIIDASRSNETAVIAGADPAWRPNPCGAWDIVCYLTRP